MTADLCLFLLQAQDVFFITGISVFLKKKRLLKQSLFRHIILSKGDGVTDKEDNLGNTWSIGCLVGYDVIVDSE